ncbi:MAG: site-specific integrase [bacterium]
MAGSVSFILKDRESKHETLIFLVYWYKQLRIKMSTGEKIKPKFWNHTEHHARETIQFNEGKNINTRLKTDRDNVMNAARDHLNKYGTIKIEILRDEFRSILRPKPSEEPDAFPKMTFLKSIEDYIRNTEKKPRTKLSYGTTLNILKKYEVRKQSKLTFDDINMDFYEDFIRFLQNYKRKTKLTTIKGYTKNTIGDHIKKIKVFMNYANDKGYTSNKEHTSRKFQTIEETAETIYLTDNELSTLYNLDLSKNKKLDRVRDLFIIGCYTGLRFSDLSQIRPENFIKNGTQLKIKTVKTGETVVIPIHWAIKEILNKYNGQIPRSVSNQKMNEYLKDLGGKAELNDKIILNKTQGGERISQTKNKCQLITVHTARRSFATNMFLAGVPTISIMKITGHITERAFMKYIKISQEQNADKLSEHPYFTKAEV